jgi:hypothetical protein
MRFLRTLTGQLVILLLLGGFVCWSIYSRFQERTTAAQVVPPAPVAKAVNPLAPQPAAQADDSGTSANTAARTAAAQAAAPDAAVVQRTGQVMTRLIVPDNQATDEGPVEPSIPKEVRAQMLAAPEPLTLFTSDYTPPAPASTKPDEFAPYGRMIRCKLVTGLESSNLSTPLVALTTEDLWHRGTDGVPRLIIPAGVEVHGPAAAHSRLRDRLEANGQYVFVWRTNDENNGRELALQGMALTRDVDPDTGSIRPSDATGGIHGDLIETASFAELKLFAASFLRAAASASFQGSSVMNPLTNQTNTTILPGLRNSAISGAQSVVDDYAARIRKQLDEDGYFVAVPAGREFYVYVPQTIDLADAHRGRVVATTAPAPSANAKVSP